MVVFQITRFLLFFVFLNISSAANKKDVNNESNIQHKERKLKIKSKRKKP